MIRLIIPFILLSLGVSNATVLKDSIGVERMAGKLYILHKVESKETLFSLSRRYHVAVEEILATNPDVKEGLKIASVVKIPATETRTNLPAGRKHVVQPSETLFSISRKYNVDIDKIATANHLKDHNLNIGQEILIPVVTDIQDSNTIAASDEKIYHTVVAGETLFSLSRTFLVDVEQIRKWNNLADNNLKLGQVIQVGDKNRGNGSETDVVSSGPGQKTIVPQPDKNVTTSNNNTLNSPPPVVDEGVKKYQIEDNEYIRNKTTTSESVKINQVLESGFAELIEGSDDTKKYLALHKTAPVGTIMQVKNEMNDLSVFVRIIGRLPETGENEKIRIRLSKIAYDHLGAIDTRFPVQISYIPR